jgi:hypothetical protein
MSEQPLNLPALRSHAATLGYQDWLAATIGQRPSNGLCTASPQAASREPRLN